MQANIRSKRRHIIHRRFLRRFFKGLVISSALVIFSLGLGIWGYHTFAGLGFVDSLLNASMILTGMGPVAIMQTTAGKLFASFYSLYSGIAFLTTSAILLGPVISRILHHFHLDLEEDNARLGKDEN